MKDATQQCVVPEEGPPLQGEEVVFGALTVTLVAFHRFGLLFLLALLPLVDGLRFTHPCHNKLLHLHALGGCRRGDAKVRGGGRECR